MRSPSGVELSQQSTQSSYDPGEAAAADDGPGRPASPPAWQPTVPAKANGPGGPVVGSGSVEAQIVSGEGGGSDSDDEARAV